MCGVAGVWALKGGSDTDVIGRSMMNALLHRGPDSQKQWYCDTNQLSLAHTRLAIIDVSEAGAQPMHSECGRYVITYNGEIYNHLQIRAELHKEKPDIQWRGSSDTETLLMAISQWGFEHSLTMLTGMFAIILWDKEHKHLKLARDRMGEKPLYYGWVGSNFVFASELKAIRQHPDFKPEINLNALAEYIETATVPAPLCIFEGLYKLPPATTVCIQNLNDLPQPSVYWSLTQPRPGSHTESRNAQSVNIDTEQWLSKLDAQLAKSIEMQMASDVPLGAFLSGGYDSSLVVAMMQRASDQKVKTYSIGFDNPEFNEAPYAKEVAKQLGTDHHELYVSADDILRLIPKLPIIWDEPFADPSQLPTHMVSALTREHVTVALSGDGGDELFGGYTRYQKADQIWKRISRIPRPIRRLLESSCAPFLAEQLRRHNTRDTVKRSAWTAKAEKLNRYLVLIGSESREDLYQRLFRQYGAANSVLKTHAKKVAMDAYCDGNDDFLHYMIHTDLCDYLPNTILTKVDRGAMAVGLETRAPLLDHALVELAWSMPTELKQREGQSKWCLKTVLHQYVPKELMERPKKGFGIPLASWLRGPLKAWAENLLSEERLTNEGYFKPEVVRGLWAAHLSGNWDNERLLWHILMFQMWLDEYVNN